MLDSMAGQPSPGGYPPYTGAKLENGLLNIDLQRELPEEKKPRVIPIEGQPTQRKITQ